MALFGHDAMRARRSNIERARQHYINQEWDSCALMLVTVMDGFINDAEPAERRGLHTREPEEMVAWDSLIGHHMGLTAVMPTFRKPIKKRVDDEVFEVYRHGIVHGTVVNYDNQIVATKAWNMLHAVVDWAAAQAKPPPESKPTWKETFASLADYGRDEKYRKEYQSWDARVGDAGFDDLDVVRSARGFLAAWQAKQWARVVPWLPPLILRYEESAGKKALFAKETYQDYPLVEYELTHASSESASVASVFGTATIGERTGPIETRWMLVDTKGDVAFASQTDAAWVLAVFPPNTFTKDA